MSLIESKEQEFDSFLISEYLKHGSIEQVFSIHKYSLPISFASYHRLLCRYRVVKSAGPNSKLSESLQFLSTLSNYKIPLERVYHKYAPNTMQVSTNTLHRMLHFIRLGITRRNGVALLVSPESDKNIFLLAKDMSLTNPSLGQAGDFSLPMTHSKANERPTESITRVMQQEMFTEDLSRGQFPFKLVPSKPELLMYINIADIKVGVYRLIVSDKNLHFSSYRLNNFSFFSNNEISNLKLRPGVGDIIKKYETICFLPPEDSIPQFDSTLNTTLYAWCSKIQL